MHFQYMFFVSKWFSYTPNQARFHVKHFWRENKVNFILYFSLFYIITFRFYEGGIEFPPERNVMNFNVVLIQNLIKKC